MNKTLIIVDAQHDFMEGGKLPVEGATVALNNIADYLNTGEVSLVITTQDWHTGKHESFKEQGGDFPEHCVKGTYGADIYEPILEAIKKNNILHYNLKKGEFIEEFSAFKHKVKDYSHWKEYLTTDNENPYIQFHDEEQIIICGLAGDICVMNTALALNESNPVIADNLTASLSEDNFRTLANRYNINIIEV